MSALMTPKQEAQKLISGLPEDSTLDDIQYHLYVLDKIRRGRADVLEGRSFDTTEARRRMNRWLED